jgi:hypothetical protein
MYNETTERVIFSCEFDKPKDNTTEYTVVWRTMKYGGEWMEDDNLTMMSSFANEYAGDVTIPNQVIKYDQFFLQVDQPIRLQYSH